MVQIPILSGIFTDGGPDVRESFPVNMVAISTPSGVSNGYLRPADGLVFAGEAPGVIRGSIVWRAGLYMVLGTSLSTISPTGVRTHIGDITDGGPVRMVYGFTHLAIASGGALWIWDGSTLTRVTDADVGVVVDVAWIDSYFVVTDGVIFRHSALNDPFTWPTLAFADPESSPDGITALMVLRNQIHVVGGETIEVYDDVATVPFAFGVLQGQQVPKGAVGTHACCLYQEAIAFIGGGRNEQPCVWIAAGGGVTKISSEEVDQLLSGFTTAQLASVVMESRNDTGRQALLIHLPDRTLVFDAIASKAVKKPVWIALVSTLVGFSAYSARHFCWAYDRWWCGDSVVAQYGYADDTISTQWGSPVRWEFSTTMLYNEGRGAVIDMLELVALPGRVALGASPSIATSYSLDGTAWSQDDVISAGALGDRTRRLQWRRQGRWSNARIQRFRGTSDAHLAFLRLEATLSPLRN